MNKGDTGLMPRIQQLSKHMINQIAAGEVIERPASVVKEMVENSIDAGATKISVEVLNDCRDIRIADNGCGIHPDDIYLAFQKHATSKIRESEDLYDIHTLGFRGEALASIISISKVTCTTRTEDFDYGTKVICENSEVTQEKTSCAIGTIMEVKDLFYNLPARLKFLKNSGTEFSYIQELIQNLAISHPEIGFTLKRNGKQMLKTSGTGVPLLAIREIYDDEVAKGMKEVSKTDEISNLKLTGFVSTPDLTRSSKKYYHIYINSRTVKDPVFLKAVDTAYKNMIAIGKYPIVVLNLELPPSDIDINVHPTKKEVRYKNTNQIFNFIVSGVMGALSTYSSGIENVVNMASAQANNQQLQSAMPFPHSAKRFDNSDNGFDNVSSNVTNILFPHSLEVEKDDTVNIPEDKMEQLQRYTQINVAPIQTTLIDNSQQFVNELNEDDEKIIGQYKDTYILIDRNEGLEIVDQHIAEERYIYEKLKREKSIISQMLFISDIIEVSATEAELIKENLEKFEKFGYGIEFTSDTELTFRKIPQMLTKFEPKEVLSDILDNIDGNIDNLEERILITTSCKSAVKAGQKLDMWKMQDIIKNWRTTEMPYTCPHGRPISKIIDHKEIAKFFQRNK